MINAQSVMEAAKKECGTELSKQAISVINAICNAMNSQLLEHQADNDSQPQYRAENVVMQKTNGHMRRPELAEIVLHGHKIGLPAGECERFFDHFQSNGWKVGVAKTPMKMWTAALSNWKRTWLERNPQFQSTSEVSFRDVKNLCREKWGNEIEWMSWASSFWNHWSKRRWTNKQGQIIDWKIELSAQVERWRTAKQTTKI